MFYILLSPSLLNVSRHKQHVQSRIHTNQAYKVHATPCHHSSNPNACMLSCPLSHYCNSLHSGCPQYLLDKLKKIQNAAARLVCKAKKSDHIHSILQTLHWLPITYRIQYKISTICFNSISGTSPHYLSDLLQPYTPARQLRSASDTRTFAIPHVNTKTFGERSFSYAGPSVWNNLPQTLRHSDAASSFKAALKRHLFNNYF